MVDDDRDEIETSFEDNLPYIEFQGNPLDMLGLL